MDSGDNHPPLADDEVKGDDGITGNLHKDNDQNIFSLNVNTSI